jgi:radical SAM-linked protein
MQEIRFYFSKTGTAKYISHLDLMRTISRALTRAEIPLWYTEGFNPHPFLTFALPLSLGIESYCESFDIRIIEEIDNEEIKNRLNSTLPDGIEITDVSSEFAKCNDIAFAEYETVFEFDESGFSDAFLNDIKTLLEKDELITTKKAKQKGKKTDVEVNLKQFIKEYELISDNNNVTFYITLAAGNSKNLNPTVLFDRLLRDIEKKPDLVRIKKLRLLKESGEIFR